MPRPRLTPPMFCGVPMIRSVTGWTLRLGAWRCDVLESKDMTISRYRLQINNGVVAGGKWREVGAQATANDAMRCLERLGVDPRKLAGRRAA